MDDSRHLRLTLLAGAAIALLGAGCLVGGIALLVWGAFKPEKAVLLPPGFVTTPEATPTPGLLGTPLSPPALPADLVEVVILPISEGPFTTLTASPRASVPMTPSASTSVTSTRLPSRVPSETPSATATASQMPPTTTPVPAGTTTPTATVLPTQTLTPSSTPTPTLTPTALPLLPDRLIIDSIGLDAPIVPVGQHPWREGNRVYSRWDVPDVFAAGWHQNSAPLGQPGNTVLNGHHNYNGEVFRHLVSVKPGDIVTLEGQGQRFFYLVVQTMTLLEEGQPIEVRQENARWILPTDDERVTLITCWPYGASTHRLVVVALPVAALGLPAEIP